VSDEREEVTKRRDIGRPVIAYRCKNVLIWGVGGLGSWNAEYITRAGAKKVTVCDNGIVTGGLLVRQNYAELDIGASKADRLAERLRQSLTIAHRRARSARQAANTTTGKPHYRLAGRMNGHWLR
jgi:tRNA A37 threonylcarbamoyladenosine dehydratase